jgi:hypothetical protein
MKTLRSEALYGFKLMINSEIIIHLPFTERDIQNQLNGYNILKIQKLAIS